MAHNGLSSQNNSSLNILSTRALFVFIRLATPWIKNIEVWHIYFSPAEM